MNDENFKTEGECPLHGWMMASGIMRWDSLIFTHCIWAGLMGCLTNRMHQKKWCSSSEPEPQESLAVSACSSMLLPPPGECVQLIFYSIKKIGSEPSHHSQHHFDQLTAADPQIYKEHSQNQRKLTCWAWLWEPAPWMVPFILVYMSLWSSVPTRAGPGDGSNE